jgi:hypothetical protein
VVAAEAEAFESAAAEPPSSNSAVVVVAGAVKAVGAGGSNLGFGRLNNNDQCS